MPLILNGDGSLSGTSLQVDSPTFVVDHSNNRVGVGTSTPSHPLHVSGSVSVSAANGSKIGYNVEDTFSSNSTTGAHYGITFGVPSNNRVSLSGWDGVHIWTGGASRLQVDGLGRVLMPNQPAFDVSQSAGAQPTGKQSYNTVYVNIGSCFNTTNSRFTAPVSGTYVFFTTIIKNANSAGVARLQLYKNGAVIQGSRQLRLAEGVTYATNGVGSWITTLSQNDYIEVYNTGDAASYGTNEYQYFNGYLIG